MFPLSQNSRTAFRRASPGIIDVHLSVWFTVALLNETGPRPPIRLTWDSQETLGWCSLLADWNYYLKEKGFSFIAIPLIRLALLQRSTLPEAAEQNIFLEISDSSLLRNSAILIYSY